MAHELAGARLAARGSSARAGLRSLDVACGPGWVPLAFAEVLAHATGLDLSPAMLSRARGLAAQAGRSNVVFDPVMRSPCPARTRRSTLSRRVSRGITSKRPRGR
jgi:SAM-dependent methyltransferase